MDTERFRKNSRSAVRQLAPRAVTAATGKLFHGDLTDRILSAAIEVHSALGPGLLESAYEECLCHELEQRDIEHRRQVDVPIHYKDVTLSVGYRADVIVEDKVLLELKAVERIHPIHEAQLLTHLRLTGMRVGLLLNFNVAVLKSGIVRRVL